MAKMMQQLELSMGQVDQQLTAGDEAGALATMSQLIDDDTYEPMRQRLVMIRAQLALMMEGPDAVAAFEAGRDEVKESPAALNELAWAAVETAESGEEVAPDLLAAALETAQTALKADPKDPSVLDTIAHLFQLTGDLDKAIKTQAMAVKNAGDLGPQLEPYLNQLKAQKAAAE